MPKMAALKKPTGEATAVEADLLILRRSPFFHQKDDDNDENNSMLFGDSAYNKENNNIYATMFGGDKENAAPRNSGPLSNTKAPQLASNTKSFSTGCRALKPSSLQLCMKMNEPERGFTSKLWNSHDSASSANIWDYSDSEAAPASSWSTLPNKALLCRPLPADVGRCTCIIVKQTSPELEGFHGGTLYTLYTNEGQGRQDRKLAIAIHKRHKGKSEFTVAQNLKGIFTSSDDSFVGNVTANLMGSKYHIWDQGYCFNSFTKWCNPLLAVVTFKPTMATWTGSYRNMRVYIPKHHSMQLRNTTQVGSEMQRINGLPRDWEGRMDRVHKLYSKIPHYNKISKQYELNFRDSGRAGLRIQSSVKNFQLTLEEKGKQTILQLGRVGKSKFVMDFRYPLTGYQAFCICLASIDSKLCCTV